MGRDSCVAAHSAVFAAVGTRAARRIAAVDIFFRAVPVATAKTAVAVQICIARNPAASRIEIAETADGLDIA